MNTLTSRLTHLYSSISRFSQLAGGMTLRPYQSEIARAVADSILRNLGLNFVVILPRQSGKNETAAQLQAYLLSLYSDQEFELVSISPTFKPQTLNAINRLESALDRNPLTRARWHRRHGCTITLGKASIHFFSGSPTANTVGATASLLLSVDEAQDIRPSTYDRKFAPMVASTHATRIFWGTAWSSTTLLAREKRLAEQQQEKDGIRRLWILTADDIAAVHPPYGLHVQSEIARLGRDHPLIRTQYFSQELDSHLGMFTPTRLALIQGNSLPLIPGFELGGAGGGSQLPVPESGGVGGQVPSSPIFKEQSPALFAGNGGGARRAEGVAFLLDVAGQDESRISASDDEAPLSNPGRDAVSLSIVSIDLSTLETLKAPAYRVVKRLQWLGLDHLTVFGQLKNLVETWRPQHIVIDATGVGEGLWSLLNRHFPSRVIPVKFSQQVKSELGWQFLAIIETGRFKDGDPTEAVRLQYVSCRADVLPGPGRILRWGVPDGARGPDGKLIHDDYLLADALVAQLDTLPWYPQFHSTFVSPSIDPLRELERHF